MNDTLVAGRYRLGRRIGTGGMGRVWLARDEVLRRSVAIKEVLLPEAPSEDEAYELRMRTLREARAAARLSHPNVVRIYDVMYADDRPWIVMEYIPSRSLAQVIKVDGPLEPAHVAKVGIAVLDALMAAHAAGVLHRDVKPGNVLLADDGRVVLTDFGLATFDELGANLTQSGVVHGSPQFIAPERALDGTSTVEADMWSLGATLYAAVEGQSPYSRPSSYQTLAALATAPPDPPKKAGALKPVLAGLLRRNPRSRMKPADVRARLQRIAGGETGRSWLVPRPRKQPSDQPTAPGTNWQGPTPAPMPQLPTGTAGAAGRASAVAPPANGSAVPAAGSAPVNPAAASGSAPVSPAAASGSAAVGPAAPVPAGNPSRERDEHRATGRAGSILPLPRRDPATLVQPTDPAAKALLNSPRTTPPTRPGTARPTSAPPSPRDRHRARLRAVVAAVAVLMMASAGYVAYRIVTGDGASAHRAKGPTGPTTPATTLATAPVTPTRVATPTPGTSGVPLTAGVKWPCPGSIPTTTYAVPAAPPDSERPGLAGNLIWYQDSTGMLIPVPPGWQMVRGEATCFYDGSLPRMLSVGSVAAPKGMSPIGVLTTLEIAARGQPGYHLVHSINQAGLLANQAEWEYTFHGPSGTMHTIVRDYLRSGRALLVAWTTTDGSWSDNLPIYSLIATGFHPPS